MARHAVEEVQSVLLTGVGGGYNLTVHPAQNYSVPTGEPEKARNEIKRKLEEIHIDIDTYGVNQEKKEEEKCL